MPCIENKWYCFHLLRNFQIKLRYTCKSVGVVLNYFSPLVNWYTLLLNVSNHMDIRSPNDKKSPRRISEQTNKISNWLINDDVKQRDFLSDNNNKHTLKKSDENFKENDINKKGTFELNVKTNWLCKQEIKKKDNKSNKKSRDQEENNCYKSSTESNTKSEYESNKIVHSSHRVHSSFSISNITKTDLSKEPKLETYKTETSYKEVHNKHTTLERKIKKIDEKKKPHKKRIKSDDTKDSERNAYKKTEKHDKGKSEQHKHRKENKIKHKDDTVLKTTAVKQKIREVTTLSKSTSSFSASKSFCKDLDKEAAKYKSGTLYTVAVKQKSRNDDPALRISPRSPVDKKLFINSKTSHSGKLKRKYILETSRNQEDYKNNHHNDKTACKEKDCRHKNEDRGESHKRRLKLEESEQKGEPKFKKEKRDELNPTKHEKSSNKLDKDAHKQNRIKSKKRSRYKTDIENNAHTSHRKQGNLDNFINKNSKPNKIYKRIKFTRSESSESCDLPCFENSNKKSKTSRSSESFKKYGVALPSIEEILREQKDLEKYKTQIEAFQDIERKTFELPFSFNNLIQPVVDSIKILDCKYLSIEEITEGFKKNLTYISDIFHGKSYSERHEKFFSNKNMPSTHTMKDLTYSTSVIVFNFDQKEHMIKLLKDEFDPDDKLTPYFFQVLLPELCLKMFMDTHEMTYEEAVKYLDVRPIVDD